MSKGDTFENDLVKLIFQGTAITGLADNAASSPLTSLYVSLHTADPGEAGNQATSEISYTGYARVAVPRNSSGFAVSGNTVTLVNPADFPEMTGGTGGTVTHAVIGTAASGAGKILYSGPVTPNIVVQSGVTPRYKTTSSVTED
jgi:hypothetical protein